MKLRSGGGEDICRGIVNGSHILSRVCQGSIAVFWALCPMLRVCWGILSIVDGLCILSRVHWGILQHQRSIGMLWASCMDYVWHWEALAIDKYPLWHSGHHVWHWGSIGVSLALSMDHVYHWGPIGLSCGCCWWVVVKFVYNLVYILKSPRYKFIPRLGLNTSDYARM